MKEFNMQNKLLFVVCLFVVLTVSVNFLSVSAQSPLKQPRILKEAMQKKNNPEEGFKEESGIDGREEKPVNKDNPEDSPVSGTRITYETKESEGENIYKKGLNAFKKKDYSTALQLFEKAALTGNASAQNNLAYMYQQGYGVSQDNTKAMEWYLKSAAQGNSGAQFNVGFIYQEMKEYEKAANWYKKSAQNENMNALNNLGFLYEKGYGVAKNERTAAELYKKSADKGHVRAQFNMGNMYEKGIGVSKNKQTAIKYYMMAAKQKYEPAIERLKKLGVKEF